MGEARCKCEGKVTTMRNLTLPLLPYPLLPASPAVTCAVQCLPHTCVCTAVCCSVSASSSPQQQRQAPPPQQKFTDWYLYHTCTSPDEYSENRVLRAKLLIQAEEQLHPKWAEVREPEMGHGASRAGS